MLSTWEGKKEIKFRFAFEKYNDNFQAHSHKKDFCYWVLMDGNSELDGFANYQSSRLNLNM